MGTTLMSPEIFSGDRIRAGAFALVLPLAMLLGAPISAFDVLHNLVPVVAGNLIGGSVLVALVYHVIYVRPGKSAASPAGRVQASTDAAP